MTRAKLDGIAAEHRMKVDGMREGAGKFRDLEIGVGEPIPRLTALQVALRDAGLEIPTVVRLVTNPGHPQYGQYYLEVPSFWNE